MRETAQFIVVPCAKKGGDVVRRVFSRLLLLAVVVGMLVATALPALAAQQKFTCTNPSTGEQRTITQSQYNKLVAEFGQDQVDQFCHPSTM